MEFVGALTSEEHGPCLPQIWSGIPPEQGRQGSGLRQTSGSSAGKTACGQSPDLGSGPLGRAVVQTDGNCGIQDR